MKPESATCAPKIDLNSLALSYLIAKEKVIEAGFADEIDWQDSLSFESVMESDFLREAAWVILSAGMKELVIRSKFGEISEAFLMWSSAHQIVRHKKTCKERALAVFGNKRKISAVCGIVEIVEKSGFENIKDSIEQDGVDAIRSLPFMGPATSYHFAKNLGLDVVKPDRHLVRVAAITGYSSPYDMCLKIAEITKDKLSVIDLVIWRFATIKPAYLDHFSGCNFQTTAVSFCGL